MSSPRNETGVIRHDVNGDLFKKVFGPGSSKTFRVEGKGSNQRPSRRPVASCIERLGTLLWHPVLAIRDHGPEPYLQDGQQRVTAIKCLDVAEGFVRICLERMEVTEGMLC